MKATLYTVDRTRPGRLSTMAKPRGGDWLDDEMRALVYAGADVLVSALSEPEQRELELLDEANAAERAGIKYVDMAMADRAVPDLSTAQRILRDLADDLAAGRHVVIHCRFGIGRSSLVAAALMVMEGDDPEVVWERLARARGLEVPDTEEQRRWVEALKPGGSLH